MNNIQTFSQSSAAYARHRPQYPRALFEYLNELASSHNRAWDCATGNGQAAISLAEYFTHVDATDLSAEQISNYIQHPKVTYQACPAEQTPFANNSFDLITVAQAVHWFDKPRFFLEVDRVLRPNGILAVWGYGLMEVNAEIDKLFQTNLMQPIDRFWADGNRELMAGYENLSLPFEKIPVTRRFEIIAEWDLDQYVNYLRTWSAVKLYQKENGIDPVKIFIESIEKIWGNPQQVKTVVMPLFMKASKKA